MLVASVVSAPPPLGALTLARHAVGPEAPPRQTPAARPGRRRAEAEAAAPELLAAVVDGCKPKGLFCFQNSFVKLFDAFVQLGLWNLSEDQR